MSPIDYDALKIEYQVMREQTVKAREAQNEAADEFNEKVKAYQAQYSKHRQAVETFKAASPESVNDFITVTEDRLSEEDAFFEIRHSMILSRDEYLKVSDNLVSVSARFLKVQDKIYVENAESILISLDRDDLVEERDLALENFISEYLSYRTAYGRYTQSLNEYMSARERYLQDRERMKDLLSPYSPKNYPDNFYVISTFLKEAALSTSAFSKMCDFCFKAADALDEAVCQFVLRQNDLSERFKEDFMIASQQL